MKFEVALEPIIPDDSHAADRGGEKPITNRTKTTGDGNCIGGIQVASANGCFAARPSDIEVMQETYAESLGGAQHLAMMKGRRPDHR